MGKMKSKSPKKNQSSKRHQVTTQKQQRHKKAAKRDPFTDIGTTVGVKREHKSNHKRVNSVDKRGKIPSMHTKKGKRTAHVKATKHDPFADIGISPQTPEKRSGKHKKSKQQSHKKASKKTKDKKKKKKQVKKNKSKKQHVSGNKR